MVETNVARLLAIGLKVIRSDGVFVTHNKFCALVTP
jgi:hypothetical protein